MGNLQIFIAALFVSAAGLNALANWLKVPYPIPLVIGGLVLGLVPGIPDFELDPDLVLLVFLPPLLYSSAFFADLRSLRTDARVISLTAIGLVLATAAAVAVVAHELIGLPWAMSFVLGAIVSPTDPAAATAIMRRVGAPRRMVNVLEGESLFNDATALVAYKVAVGGRDRRERLGPAHRARVLRRRGRWDRDRAGGRLGDRRGEEARHRRQHRADDLAVQRLRGVHPGESARRLGRARGGHRRRYLGFRAPEIASLESRMQGYALWSILTFLLNATLFILIGLQLPVIVDGLSGRPAGEVIGYAAVVCAAVIAVRFLWNFIVTFIIRAIDRRPSQRARRADWRTRVVGELGGDARRGLAGGGAGAAAPHRRRRAAARPRR